jgi:predicted DNA-binding transcriptional regulator AlpA
MDGNGALLPLRRLRGSFSRMQKNDQRKHGDGAHNMSRNQQDSESEYLTASQVRARYGGASDMWLFRRIRDHGFPAPVHFGTPIRYFRISEVIRWEREAATRDYTSASKPPRKAVQS